jgi:HEAT repeat protein
MWTATYPACPVIVTVREAAYRYRPQLPGFNELEVVEFHPEDIWEFVKNWFDGDKTMRREDKVTDLKIRLERSPRIMELASNPLLLSLIVMVYERHLDLPESRARLYEKCVNILLTEWDASQGRLRYRGFDVRYKWQLLEDVAWHFHGLRKRYFPDEELLEVIANFLPAVSLPPSDKQKLLEEIAIENGLLREQSVGYYSFSHLTFQEYFTARYIIEHKDLTTLQTYLGDTWWEEVLSLYAGDIPDASPLLGVLLGQEEGLFCTNLLLAGHCLSAKPTVREVTLREQVIDRLFNTLLATRYILLRESITKVLATIGGKETVFGREIFSRLQRLAEDDTVDLEIRKQIVYALGKFGGVGLVQELGAMLLNKNINNYLRASAARALEKFGGSDMRDAMLELLEDEQEDWRVRQSIAIALGACSDKCAVANLLALLKDKRRNNTVQSTCAFALGILGDNSVVEVLLDLLSDDEVEMYVRGSIAVALGKLGDTRAVPTLLNLLADKHLGQFIGQRIALTLGSLELDANTVSTLLTLITNEELDVHVRMSIAALPGKYYDKSAIQRLREILLNTGVNALVRASIATALGALGDQIVIPDMQDMLLDQTLDVNVRGSIIAALRVLGIKEVTSELLTLLSNQQLNQDVLLDISKSLSNFSNYSHAERQTIAQELVVLLPQDNIKRAVRQNIALALGHLGSRNIVQRLLELLRDQNVDRDVRQNIAYIVTQMTQDEQCIQELVSLLPTTDIPNDLYAALWALNRRRRRRPIMLPR